MFLKIKMKKPFYAWKDDEYRQTLVEIAMHVPDYHDHAYFLKSMMFLILSLTLAVFSHYP